MSLCSFYQALTTFNFPRSLRLVLSYSDHIKLPTPKVGTKPKQVHTMISKKFTKQCNFNHNGTHYEANIATSHTGMIINRTEVYMVNVFYNNASGHLNEHSVPFPRTVMTSDLTVFGYFWVVLAGIVSSRFITFILEKKNETELSISLADGAWIAFTFVIVVIGFASFKEQLSNFTNVLIFNVSLAFGFGFASQKILQVARLYPETGTDTTGTGTTGYRYNRGTGTTGTTTIGSQLDLLLRTQGPRPGGANGKTKGASKLISAT